MKKMLMAAVVLVSFAAEIASAKCSHQSNAGILSSTTGTVATASGSSPAGSNIHGTK